jgi:probable phosphoglycerate mutase
MREQFQQVYLARHGETAWTLSGQHTGRTDLPLTPRGEENARRLGRRLADIPFTRVFTSPLERARRTSKIAGFATAELDPDLVEWDYGRYDGRTTAEILAERPDWNLFRDGGPGGESPADLSARADRVLARLRGVPGDVLLFSSGHFLRVLTARWLALDVGFGRYLYLGTAAVSILGFDHNPSEPIVRLWNDTGHLAG